MVTKNVGNTDKIVRYIIGVLSIIGAIIFAQAGNTTLAIVLGVVAAISIITAAISFCGLYALFGISTCPAKSN